MARCIAARAATRHRRRRRDRSGAEPKVETLNPTAASRTFLRRQPDSSSASTGEDGRAICCAILMQHLVRWPRELQLAQEGSERHIANKAMQHVIGLKAHQPAGALGE